LPVSAAEEQDLCDQAVTLLPEDGLPAVAGRLLRPLSERVWNRSVLRRIEVDGESDAVLWSLMRRRPDVDAAPGLLVARRADQRKKGMVWGLLLKALDELHAASQSQLTQHLGNNHGWSRSSDRLANVLSRQRDDGAVIRIPGGVYLRPDAALDGVFDALRHHHASILRAVRAGCSPATGTPELGILARYLYRSKEWSPALEVLDRLLARGDLPEADKREYGRLRQVARVRMEGPG